MGKVMKKTSYEHIAGIFKALAHPTRAKIVDGLIRKDECNVTKMVENLGIPQPTVSQHLNILRSHGILEGYRKGNQVCYKVVNEQVKKIFSAIE
jgi:DNA-binding transcriptional ArsR family regulator